MKYLIFLGIILTFYSCSNDKNVSSTTNSIVKAQTINALEIKNLNTKASSSSGHNMSVEEINMLYSEGLISSEEKEELLKLTI